MTHLIYDPLVQALGSTVLHSFWQATLLAILLWVVSRNASLKPASRYWLGMGALAFQLVLSIITLLCIYEPASAPMFTEATVMTWLNGASEPIITNFSVEELSLSLTEKLYFGLALVWLLGLVFGSLRLIGGHWYVHNRYRKRLLPVPVLWEEMSISIANKLNIAGEEVLDKIRLSAKIASPAMIGLLRPMILFPLSVVNQLEPEEIEALLAHEIVHYANKDHWWNFWQSCTEILFYFNPAIHWISSRIREEREFRCDQQVASIGVDPIIYAKSLYRVEEQRLVAVQHALAARPGSLLGRIELLLRNTPNYYRMKPGLLFFLLLLVGTLFSSKAAVPDLFADETLSATEGDNCDYQSSNAGIQLTQQDTIVPSGKTTTTTETRQTIIVSRDGEDVELEKVNGTITKLKVDGKIIDENRYDEYAKLIEEVENIPPPPAPPAPPAPPRPGSFIVPPPPPPAPPVPNKSDLKTFLYDSDGGRFEFNITEDAMRFNIPGTDSMFNMDFSKLENLEELARRRGMLDEDGELLPEYEDEFEGMVEGWSEGLIQLRENFDDFGESLFRMRVESDDEEGTFRLLMQTEDGEYDVLNLSGGSEYPLHFEWRDEDGTMHSLGNYLSDIFGGRLVDGIVVLDTVRNSRGEIMGFVEQDERQRIAIEEETEAFISREIEAIPLRGRNDRPHQISGQRFLRLVRDFQRRGLIKQEEIDRFQISEKRMKVNGKKVTAETFNRFVKEYAANHQINWSKLGKFDININIDR